MAAFLTSELDFIFFFYGLAFILLGSVCFAIARGGQGMPWAVLGLFAYVHGVGEWLDLTALVAGDAPAFATGRTALMTGSFLLLLEFARLEAARIELKVPGRWIYAPLIALVALGGMIGGLNVTNALARYAIGFPGAAATSLVLALHAKGASGSEKWWPISGAVGFALYSVAAGIIVPAALFWPATVLNSGTFTQATAMPIQLVRGLLACWMAFSVWGSWKQKLSRDVASSRYTKFLQKQFVWTLVAMAAILVLGWTLTEYLGGIYKQNVQNEAQGNLDLISSRLSGETSTIDGMVRALAGSSEARALLTGGRGRRDGRANSVLNLDTEASGARLGYILDKSGMVIASSDGEEAARTSELNFGSTSYFQTSIAGEAGYYFSFDAASGERDYYASYPIHDAAGEVVGVAVLKKSLDHFKSDLMQFGRPFFLVDPNGVVVLTNRPTMMFRTLWPLPEETKQALSHQFGKLNDKPMLEREVVDATWTTSDGARDFVRRRSANHSEWSLVLLTAPQGIFANRVLGIIITLQMATLALVYLVGRERWIYDSVQLDKRLETEDLARKLDFRATTDSLTGLFNRFKFNQELSIEMLRALRYQTPLSLVFYDIDHFKRVNDTYGHQAGDKVLITLSSFVATRIRKIDVLARWGGEEFIILVPGSATEMARGLAESLRDGMCKLSFDDVGTVSCSFGVAQLKAGDTAETFIARADEAMYRAKTNGRNRVEVEVASLLTVDASHLESVA
ncbi:MAG: diguanylate cyclase [Pseudolabrys sp.]|nr:diguanylate cyclase [Pseudolabrys sp.]